MHSLHRVLKETINLIMFAFQWLFEYRDKHGEKQNCMMLLQLQVSYILFNRRVAFQIGFYDQQVVLLHVIVR
jgi:hypothetical protein